MILDLSLLLPSVNPISPRARREIRASTMTTEQQIEESIINIITSLATKTRVIISGRFSTCIFIDGKKELRVSSFYIDEPYTRVEIYRRHLWGLFKTNIEGIWIRSEPVRAKCKFLSHEKKEEEKNKQEEREEKKRHAILSFLNNNH